MVPGWAIDQIRAAAADLLWGLASEKSALAEAETRPAADLSALELALLRVVDSAQDLAAAVASAIPAGERGSGPA